MVAAPTGWGAATAESTGATRAWVATAYPEARAAAGTRWEAGSEETANTAEVPPRTTTATAVKVAMAVAAAVVVAVALTVSVAVAVAGAVAVAVIAPEAS
ncbi:hypothetical protein CYMTET_41127 [Cymbomonas tetramitiformis]|uniref:Uncharacterized protein n=1 Tax=Cymbomonas tetramitiformis TaxID=36881 RepID=A0AAE0F2K0_9CHLO|nr:hypothetical protein CYMTET_41127 [Cymbomonas tetramitiformis]